MRRTALAMILPPAAVVQHGAAGSTAAPIGVVWLAGVVSLCYGLAGGAFGGAHSPSWPEILFGIVVWIITGIWARLVIGGVRADVEHGEESTLDHQVPPSLDETDPLQEVEMDKR